MDIGDLEKGSDTPVFSLLSELLMSSLIISGHWTLKGTWTNQNKVRNVESV